LTESSPERRDEIIPPRATLCPRRLCSRLGEWWCRSEPEANEQRQGLERDPDVALEPRDAAIDQIEALGNSRLPPLVGVR